MSCIFGLTPESWYTLTSPNLPVLPMFRGFDNT